MGIWCGLAGEGVVSSDVIAFGKRNLGKKIRGGCNRINLFPFLLGL